jgi:hypothetical protein
MRTFLPALTLLVACGNGNDGFGPDGIGSKGNGQACTMLVEQPLPPAAVKPIGGVTVETIAGSSAVGKADGVGPNASFYNPVNVLLAGSDLIVADFDNSMLRYVTTAGEVTTVLDPGSKFTRPFGLAWLGNTLFVETDQNPDGSFDPDAGTIWRVDISVGDAALIVEETGRPRGLAPRGNELAMADIRHHAVRLLAPSSREVFDWVGKWDCPGFEDGVGEEGRFEMPYGLAVDGEGNIIVADRGNHAIRRITKNGKVTTIAGQGTPGMVDGSHEEAYFNDPIDVAVDGHGRVFVSDLGNNRIRMIDQNGVVTVAGSGQRGFADGSGEEAQFHGQEGIDVTPDGKTVYVADGTLGEPGLAFHRIRRVTLP